MKLRAWGQFYVKNDSSGESCEAGSTPGDCKFNGYDGFGCSDLGWWWSLPKDSEGLTVIESKNKASQVCWANNNIRRW